MRRHRLLTVLAGLAGALAGLLALPAGVAAKGGWAVTTLDSSPEIEAGVPEEIGFTIRQHGVSPVDVDDVSVVVTDAAGDTHRFIAVRDGVPGHYVVLVEVPVAGAAAWAIDQGWFGRQELGTLLVSPEAPVVSSGSRYLAPKPIRWALPLLAGVLAMFAVGDAVRRLRPSRAPV